MNCGIYSIQSPSGKLYIGSSKEIKTRFRRYERLKCKAQKKLYASFIKYGVENHTFQVIYECSEEELLSKEQMCIDFYKPELNCLPIAGRPPSMFGEQNPNWKGGYKRVRHEQRKQYEKEYMSKPENKQKNREAVKRYRAKKLGMK